MPERAWIGLCTALVAVAAGFVALYAVAITAYGTCDGDGGDPFSARDSMAGRFCESPTSTAYFWAQLVAPVGCVLVLGTIAVVQRRWRRLGLGVLVGLGIVVAMAALVFALPDRCSAEQRAEGGDCSTY